MSFYYVSQITFNSKLLVVAPLDKLKLEFQDFLFKITILHNASELKKDGKECNHLICMRLFISSFEVLI